MRLFSTPAHTIGPFFHDALARARSDADAAPLRTGDICIEGSAKDGAGEQIPVWLIAAWVPQAVPAETQAGIPAPGFRRFMNNAAGRFRLVVPLPPPGQPAAYLTPFGIDLSHHHHSAVFLPPRVEDCEAAGLLDAVPADRRATLVAEPLGEARYAWTLRTQGDRETVFFDYR